MTELEFRFRTEVEFSAPVRQHVFSLHCLPMEDEVQRLEAYTVMLEPAAGYGLRKDGFGGWLVCGSCQGPHTKFVYASQGIVRVDLSRPAPADRMNPVLRYPTALTQPGEAVRALWEQLPLAGKSPHAQAELLCRAAADALAYTPGVTGNATTAEEALKLGRGVCQDYTHLLLALARLSGFGARYCMGLIPGEGATHAWAELALPEGWVGYDPTHAQEAGETAVRFAVGRDAADCPAERGVFCGQAAQTMQVKMQLRERSISGQQTSGQ